MSGKFLPGPDPRRWQGRKTGAKAKLSTLFLEKLQEKFEKHGEECFDKVIATKPLEFLQMCQHLIPKEMLIKAEVTHYEAMSDAELDERINALLAEGGIAAPADGEGQTLQ